MDHLALGTNPDVEWEHEGQVQQTQLTELHAPSGASQNTVVAGSLGPSKPGPSGSGTMTNRETLDQMKMLSEQMKGMQQQLTRLMGTCIGVEQVMEGAPSSEGSSEMARRANAVTVDVLQRPGSSSQTDRSGSTYRLYQEATDRVANFRQIDKIRIFEGKNFS